MEVDRHIRDLTLFRGDLLKLIQEKGNRPISQIFVNRLREVRGLTEDDIIPVVEDIGWTFNNIGASTIVPIPKEESHRLKPTLKKPTRVPTKLPNSIPIPNRFRKSPNSDGEYLGADDGRHPADED